MNKLIKFFFTMSMLLSSIAFTDEFHYKNLLIGGKAIGLGGAFVAISDDLSSMYYNPAGLSFNEVSYSVSINTMAWEKTDVIEIFGNGESFTRNSFTVIPSFIGFSRADGEYSYGAYFSVTDFSKERTSTDALYISPGALGSEYQQLNEFINIDLDNSAYRMGFTTAYKLDSSSSIGATINVDYKEYTTVQGSGITATEIINEMPIFSGFNASVRFTDINVIAQPALGYLKKWDDVNFGVKIARDFVISRDFDVTSTLFLNSPVQLPPNIITSARINASSDVTQEYPYQIQAGLAYESSGVLLIAEINYYTKVSTNPFYIDGVKPITRNFNAVTNFAIAMQYQFSSNDTLRLGIFSDKSNASIDTSIQFQRIEDIDLMGVSVGFDTKFYDTPISFGAYYKFGDGNIRVADRRIAEAVVGLSLFPDAERFDVFEAKKESFIAYFNVDF
jgi:long-chain fatty acid transport protein